MMCNYLHRQASPATCDHSPSHASDENCLTAVSGRMRTPSAECGESFSVLKFDVTDEEAVQKAAAKVAIRMDGHCLLGLVNNAG